MRHDPLVAVLNKTFQNLIDNFPSYEGGSITFSGIIYDNDGQPTPSGYPWIRFTSKPGDARIVSLGGVGSRRVRKNGILLIQVFDKLDAGSARPDFIADAIEHHYVGVNVGGVTYQTPVVEEGKRSGDQWMIVVKIPFFTDRIS